MCDCAPKVYSAFESYVFLICFPKSFDKSGKMYIRTNSAFRTRFRESVCDTQECSSCSGCRSRSCNSYRTQNSGRLPRLAVENSKSHGEILQEQQKNFMKRCFNCLLLKQNLQTNKKHNEMHFIKNSIPTSSTMAQAKHQVNHLGRIVKKALTLFRNTSTPRSSQSAAFMVGWPKEVAARVTSLVKIDIR